MKGKRTQYQSFDHLGRSKSTKAPAPALKFCSDCNASHLDIPNNPACVRFGGSTCASKDR